MQRFKISFDTWIQALGMLGVIGGLIFVGLEMRQTQKIALADQMNNRMSVLIEFNNAFTAANLDFYAASTHQPEKDELFSNAEKGARNAMNIQWSLHENDYFQYSRGFMTEQVWQAMQSASANHESSSCLCIALERHIPSFWKSFLRLLFPILVPLHI